MVVKVTVVVVVVVGLYLGFPRPVAAQGGFTLCTFYNEAAVNNGAETWYTRACSELLFWQDTEDSQDFITLAFATADLLENYEDYTLVLPPASVDSVTLECYGSVTIDWGDNEGSQGTSGSAGVYKNPYYGGDVGSIATDETGLYTVTVVSRAWNYYYSDFASWWAGCSGGCANGPTLAPFHVRTSAIAITDNESHTRMATCRVVDWEDADPENPWIPGWYYPPTPTATPGVQAVPTWSVPVTREVNIGLTPMPTECYRVVWGYTTTVPVWDVEVGFPETEACVQPYTMEFDFIGIDWWQWMVTFGVLLGVGALVSIAKRA